MTAPPSAPTPLLPGQAAAPPGPCDLTGMYVMHHAFRRDLARLAAVARATPPSATATWRPARRWWRNVAELLHDHHSKEDDVLWPALLARVDADGRRVLDAMEAEHGRIDPLVVQVHTALDALAAGTATTATRDAAAAALDQLHRLLDAHLAHEERDAIPLVQRHLDAAEWAHLERTGLGQKPAPALLLFMLPWLADGLQDEDLAPLLDQGGPAVRLVLRLGTGRYRRLRARAFPGLEPATAQVPA